MPETQIGRTELRLPGSASVFSRQVGEREQLPSTLALGLRNVNLKFLDLPVGLGF
jgi:hypothetical protein